MRKWLTLVLLLFSLSLWADQGGIPHNPTKPGEPGQPGEPGTPGTPNAPGAPPASGISAPGVQPAAQTQAAAVAANKAEVNATNAANSASATQTAITLRSLLLTPHSSWDLWANATGVFDSRNQALISSGFDYRIKPAWVLGVLANWAMARHYRGSAMQGGPYTALSQWGFYVLASEVYNQKPENWITFAQAGYVAKLGNWLAGPFYAAQFCGRNDALQNQAGLWLNRPGRLSPEVQVMYQGNAKATIPHRREAVWAGGSLNYQLSRSLILSAGYNFLGNSHFQVNEVTLGFRVQF